MKKNVSNSLKLLGAVLISALFLSSCAEGHYYHRYNHHTRGWYDHRHQTPPAGVNFEVDIIR